MERERITISIKRHILKLVDDTVDGTAVRNRSHAIEALVKKAINLSEIKNVIIMLGGDNAVSLIPSTTSILLALKQSGIEKVYIATGYLSSKIKQKIGSEKEYGLKIEYIKGEGSGGAILSLKKQLQSTFVVIEPKYSINRPISKLVEYHKNHRAIATIFSDDMELGSGLYVFEPDIFQYIPKGFSLLQDDIFPKLAEEDRLVIAPVIE
jgi:NDP-sugar pyrophosphorylase family protein